jgi:hypothetical protein
MQSTEDNHASGNNIPASGNNIPANNHDEKSYNNQHL